MRNRQSENVVGVAVKYIRRFIRIKYILNRSIKKQIQVRFSNKEMHDNLKYTRILAAQKLRFYGDKLQKKYERRGILNRVFLNLGNTEQVLNDIVLATHCTLTVYVGLIVLKYFI